MIASAPTRGFSWKAVTAAAVPREIVPRSELIPAARAAHFDPASCHHHRSSGDTQLRRR